MPVINRHRIDIVCCVLILFLPCPDAFSGARLAVQCRTTTTSTDRLLRTSLFVQADVNVTTSDFKGSAILAEDASSLSPPPPPSIAMELLAESNPNKNAVQQWLESNILQGIPATPELLAIVTIYFVEGALGLARLAQSYLLKDELGLGPAELSALTGIFVLPWTIKRTFVYWGLSSVCVFTFETIRLSLSLSLFRSQSHQTLYHLLNHLALYGFLSDGFPLFGYQRKSYLILAGVLGGLSYAVLGWPGLWDTLPTSTAVSGTVAALLISSACIAFSDVVADGIVVTRTRQSNDPSVAGGLQSLCWGASAVGGLLSAYFSGSLLEVLPVRSIFGITAVLPFLVALIALGVDEKPIVKDAEHRDDTLLDGVKEQVETLWETLRQPSIWKPALFLFLWQSTPTAE